MGQKLTQGQILASLYKTSDNSNFCFQKEIQQCTIDKDDGLKCTYHRPHAATMMLPWHHQWRHLGTVSAISFRFYQ